VFDFSQSNEFELVSSLVYFNTVLDNFLVVKKNYINNYISKNPISDEIIYKLKNINKLINENVRKIKARNDFFLDWYCGYF